MDTYSSLRSSHANLTLQYGVGCLRICFQKKKIRPFVFSKFLMMMINAHHDLQLQIPLNYGPRAVD